MNCSQVYWVLCVLLVNFPFFFKISTVETKPCVLMFYEV